MKEDIGKIREEIAEMHTDIKYIKESMESVVAENKANTEFRLKTTGMVTVIGFITGTLGGLMVWLLNKFWGK